MNYLYEVSIFLLGVGTTLIIGGTYVQNTTKYVILTTEQFMNLQRS